AAGTLGVVVEGPQVARAVVRDRGGAELAGDERRDERAAALVPARDEPHGQPGAAALAVHVQAQRAGGASAARGLLCPEEAEEDAAARGGLGQRERPRRAELIVERHGADLVGVVRRLRRPRDLPPELARRLAGEIRFAVAEVLRHRRGALRHDAVVVTFPAGVLVERFGLLGLFRLVVGPAVPPARAPR